MKTYKLLPGVAFAAALGLGAPALAQQQAAPVPADTAEAAAMATGGLVELDDDADITYQGVSLDDIEGMNVVTATGEELGEIEEVLGTPAGEVQAFVVEIEEGFLGLREREVVVPADRLVLNPEEDRFTTELAEGEIESLQVWED